MPHTCKNAAHVPGICRKPERNSPSVQVNDLGKMRNFQSICGMYTNNLVGKCHRRICHEYTKVKYISWGCAENLKENNPDVWVNDPGKMWSFQSICRMYTDGWWVNVLNKYAILGNGMGSGNLYRSWVGISVGTGMGRDSPTWLLLSGFPHISGTGTYRMAWVRVSHMGYG